MCSAIVMCAACQFANSANGSLLLKNFASVLFSLRAFMRSCICLHPPPSADVCQAVADGFGPAADWL